VTNFLDKFLNTNLRTSSPACKLYSFVRPQVPQNRTVACEAAKATASIIFHEVFEIDSYKNLVDVIDWRLCAMSLSTEQV